MIWKGKSLFSVGSTLQLIVKEVRAGAQTGKEPVGRG